MKPRLAVYSPLPPARTGTADYCHEQLPHLAEHFDLTVVVEKHPEQADPVPDGVEVVDARDWSRRGPPESDVPRLYHLGNNVYHEYALEECLRRPGVIMLHDFVLHHLIVEMTLARGNEKRYAEFLERDHGPMGRRVAELRSRFIFSEYQQFLMPLNRHIASSSLGVIVHSRWAKRNLERTCPGLDVACVPHHYSPPAPGSLETDRAAARDRMGMPRDKLVFLSIGFVTPPKRVDQTVRALGTLVGEIPDFEFWIVGECRNPAALDRVIDESGMRGRTHLTGYVPLEDFQVAIQACDAVINLRYPSAGESSGTLIRALGMGRPAVVFEFGAFADIPDDAAVKIPLDTHSTDGLASALRRLATDPALRERIGTAASAYANTACALPVCARAYTDAIRRMTRVPSLTQPAGG